MTEFPLMMLKTLGGLGIVFLFMGGMVALIRYLQSPKNVLFQHPFFKKFLSAEDPQCRPPHRVYVKQQLHLGHKNTLHVLAWQGREYLIASSPQHGFVVDSVLISHSPSHSVQSSEVQ